MPRCGDCGSWFSREDGGCSSRACEGAMEEAMDAAKRRAEKTPPFVIDDGGRAAAGFKGRKAGDCVTRAIAIATEKPYREIYDLVNEAAKKERPRARNDGRRRGRSNARTGVHKATTRKIMAALGWTWTPTMHIGSGCKVHLANGELPMGRLVVAVSKHLVAVIDGVVHDMGDVSRGGTRCVYGFFSKGARA